MDGKELIKALHNGKRIYGTLIISPSPAWVEAVEGTGLDCVFLDTEHMPLDNHQLAWMCQAYKAKGIAPIVRITKPDPHEATKALHTGASAVVAPYVETAEEVEQLRAAVKLRPVKGKRLRGILSGSERPQEQLSSYLEKFNEGKALIANIESVPAIEALDEILAVPGLDGLLIGPHDLSCSLGVPEQYDHPLVVEAVHRIIEKARAKNVGVGVHNWPSAEGEIELAKAGLNLILHFSDMTMFRNALFRDLGKIRKALGDKVVSRLSEQAI